jgi:hypothetical protein
MTVTYPFAAPNPAAQAAMCEAISAAIPDPKKVRQALEEGADPRLGPRGETSWRPLERVVFSAATRPDIPQYLTIAKLLLAHGADPADTPYGWGALGMVERCIHHCTPEATQGALVLLEGWPGPRNPLKTVGELGRTLLHTAAQANNVDVARWILARSDPNEALSLRDDSGNTPLLLARKPEMVQALLQAGADPLATNDKQQTLLWLLLGGVKHNGRNTNPLAGAIAMLIQHGHRIEDEPRQALLKGRVTRCAHKFPGDTVTAQLRSHFVRNTLMKHAKNKQQEVARPHPKRSM